MARQSSNRRTAQRETTRHQLLQAALRVVAVQGFAGATTLAIARETGKAHGTVFAHFHTRDALVAEVVEEVGRAMSERLNDLPADAPGMEEVLDARLLGEATTLPAAARVRLLALQSGIASRLRRAHTHEVERGTARALDPIGLTNTWIALTNHFLMNRDLFAPGASVIAMRGAELKAQFLQMTRP
jgi:AcrR family transcriptional regulator